MRKNGAPSSIGKSYLNGIHHMIYLLIVLFVCSVLANAYQLYLARKPRKIVKYDLSAQQLLHDLTRHGGAVVKVDVINPADLLLRSPRT